MVTGLGIGENAVVVTVDPDKSHYSFLDYIPTELDDGTEVAVEFQGPREAHFLLLDLDFVLPALVLEAFDLTIIDTLSDRFF
jgi:hypothetical protein